mmetsp:Transcript_101160/g.294567  ORF Transcript_101160/g.294567 Transcript_101160/m.294567 type:complete len:283 (+) Transcript_101160:267-1115(+)
MTMLMAFKSEGNATSDGRSASNARWEGRVGEHTAHSTHRNLRRAAITADPLLGILVHSAVAFEALVRIMAPEPDVAALAPVRAPRVADQVVLALSVVSAIANHDDGMIHSRVDAAPVEDALAVDGPVGGLDGRHHWALCREGSLQRHQLVHRQRRVARNPGARARGGPTSAVATRLIPPVVVRMEEAVLGDVLEGKLCGGAMAAPRPAAVPRILDAVHELLEGEGLHLVARDLRVHLQHAHRCHRPAGAAGPLVLQEGRRSRPAEALAPVRALGDGLLRPRL